LRLADGPQRGCSTSSLPFYRANRGDVRTTGRAARATTIERFRARRANRDTLRASSGGL
jgi:hypothetical protein